MTTHARPARWWRHLMLTVAAVLAAATLGVGAAPPAFADDSLRIFNWGAWMSDLDATQGPVEARLAIRTPAPCPAGTTRHKAAVTKVTPANPADKTAADAWPEWGNLYSPSSVDLPGPFDYGASANFLALAQMHGLTIIPGTYRVDFTCRNNLGTQILATWSGEFVVDQPGHFTVPPAYAVTDTAKTAAGGGAGSGGAAGPSGSPSGGAGQSGGPTPAASPTSGGAPSSASSAGAPSDRDSAARDGQAPRVAESWVPWWAWLLGVLALAAAVVVSARAMRPTARP